MEGIDRPQMLSQKEYNELGKTVSLNIRVCIPIFGSGKFVVSDSVVFVARGITEFEAKGIYVADLIKKRRYWPKVLPGDLIDTHFEDK